MIGKSNRLRPVFAVIKNLQRESSTLTPVDIKSMIRVNLAGETGADKIYAGQMAVLGTMRLNF